MNQAIQIIYFKYLYYSFKVFHLTCKIAFDISFLPFYKPNHSRNTQNDGNYSVRNFTAFGKIYAPANIMTSRRENFQQSELFNDLSKSIMKALTRADLARPSNTLHTAAKYKRTHKKGTFPPRNKTAGSIWLKYQLGVARVILSNLMANGIFSISNPGLKYAAFFSPPKKHQI